MENKVIPLHDRVIVQPNDSLKETGGGIIIPDTAKEKPMQGKVIAVGQGKKDEPLIVKVGDTVLYGKHAGSDISIEGMNYLILKESEIMAIV